MSQSLSHILVWWRTVLLFVLLVLCVNALISFIHSKLYPFHCVRSTHLPLYIQRESIEALDDPRQLYLHVDTPPLPLVDKDIIVRAAYPKKAQYGNYTVILLEARKTILDQRVFEKCGVGEYESSQFRVISIDAETCNVGRRFTHTQALLYCYNVTANHLDRAWVTYRKYLPNNKMGSFQVRAERPVLLHSRARDSGKGSVVVCAAMLPHYTPFVEDWIRYQKTIGVNHVHLILESLFLNQGRFDKDFLQVQVEKSYLSVEFWHQWLNETDVCDHSLDLALYSCALQFQSSYTHIVFGDPWDFFVPRDSLNLPEYLSQWCPAMHCRFEWKNWFYRHCAKADSNGNITDVIPVTGFSHRDKHFTVLKSSLLDNNNKDGRWHVFDSSEGTGVPMDKGYFVHLGKHANASDVRILPEHEHC